MLLNIYILISEFAIRRQHMDIFRVFQNIPEIFDDITDVLNIKITKPQLTDKPKDTSPDFAKTPTQGPHLILANANDFLKSTNLPNHTQIHITYNSRPTNRFNENPTITPTITQINMSCCS